MSLNKLNKNILITGANRGLGKELVKVLEKNKIYNVIKCSRTRIRGFYKLNLNKEKSITKAIFLIKKRYKRIDIVINNAAEMSNINHLDTDMKKIKKVFDTNFFSHYLINKLILKHMIKKNIKGIIINISSGSGLFSEGMNGTIDYCLSKSLINAMTYKFSKLIPKKIKIIAVCPGWIKTRMGGKEAPNDPKSSALKILKLISTKKVISGNIYRNNKLLNW